MEGHQAHIGRSVQAEPNTKLDLTVTTAPNKAETHCVVDDFVLELPPGPKRVLRLTFAKMTFSQTDGKSPQLDVEGVNAEFLGDLTLLKTLATRSTWAKPAN